MTVNLYARSAGVLLPRPTSILPNGTPGEAPYKLHAEFITIPL